MPHIHELYDFTTSAFILHPEEPKILLLLHNKLGKWLQPGGHIELHEDPLEALAHELLEETGLKLDECEIIEPAEQPPHRNAKTIPLPIHINVHDLNDTHKHIDMHYLLKSSSDKLSPQEDESPIIKWLTIYEIVQLHKEGEVYDGTLDIAQWISDTYM